METFISGTLTKMDVLENSHRMIGVYIYIYINVPIILSSSIWKGTVLKNKTNLAMLNNSILLTVHFPSQSGDTCGSAVSKKLLELAF